MDSNKYSFRGLSFKKNSNLENLMAVMPARGNEKIRDSIC